MVIIGGTKMNIGDKIKGETEFYAEIQKAEILEVRFHMGKVRIMESINESRIGEELVVLLNEFKPAQ